MNRASTRSNNASDIKVTLQVKSSKGYSIIWIADIGHAICITNNLLEKGNVASKNETTRKVRMKGIIFANAKLKEVGAKMKRIDMTGLIEKYSEKYRKAGKKEKSRILDEFIELTEYNRSYASLKLRRGYSKKNKRSKFTKRRGRKKKYD